MCCPSAAYENDFAEAAETDAILTESDGIAPNLLQIDAIRIRMASFCDRAEAVARSGVRQRLACVGIMSRDCLPD